MLGQNSWNRKAAAKIKMFLIVDSILRLMNKEVLAGIVAGVLVFAD